MRTAVPPLPAAAPKAGPCVGPGGGAGAWRCGAAGARGAEAACSGRATESGAGKPVAGARSHARLAGRRGCVRAAGRVLDLGGPATRRPGGAVAEGLVVTAREGVSLVCIGSDRLAGAGAGAFVAVEVVCSTVGSTTCLTGAVAFETVAAAESTVCDVAEAVFATTFVTFAAALATGAGAARTFETLDVAAVAACTVLVTVEVTCAVGAAVAGAGVLGTGSVSARAHSA